MGTLAFDVHRPKSPPDGEVRTAMFLHGILGTKRNWRTPANVFLKKTGFAQALTVDHRGHGGSRDYGGGVKGPTVAVCAEDLEILVKQELNGQVPDVLCAHSFGGKVALAFIEARLKRRAPIPQHTFILDSLPGTYTERLDSNTGKFPSNSVHGIFETLESDSLHTFPSTKAAIEILVEKRGVPLPIAQWLTSGCFIPKGSDHYVWGFDLPVARSLFNDFCARDAWPFLEQFDGHGNSADGSDAKIHFVRAGKNKMWTDKDVDALKSLEGGGVSYHLMSHVGHWLHVDDCEGLITLVHDNIGR